MKHKIVKLKNGEARIDYFKEKDYSSFRFETLTKLLEGQALMIRVDTNLIKSELRHIDLSRNFEAYLKEKDIPYEVVPTAKANFKKVFGVTVKSGSQENAYMILFTIPAEAFTREFFDQFLANADLDIGINPKQPFEVLCKELQKGYFFSFVESGYFEAYIYDSNYIGSMRVSKEINLDLI